MALEQLGAGDRPKTFGAGGGTGHPVSRRHFATSGYSEYLQVQRAFHGLRALPSHTSFVPGLFPPPQQAELRIDSLTVLAIAGLTGQSTYRYLSISPDDPLSPDVGLLWNSETSVKSRDQHLNETDRIYIIQWPDGSVPSLKNINPSKQVSRATIGQALMHLDRRQRVRGGLFDLTGP